MQQSKVHCAQCLFYPLHVNALTYLIFQQASDNEKSEQNTGKTPQLQRATSYMNVCILANVWVCACAKL